MQKRQPPRVPVACVFFVGMAFVTLAVAVEIEFWRPDPADYQTKPAVATDAEGGMVVVWQKHLPSSPQPLDAIRLQRFDHSGAAAGPSIRVDLLPGDRGRNPALDVAADGSFVVVWEGGPAIGTYRRTVWAQRFNPDGTHRGVEIRVTPEKMLAELEVVAPSKYDGPAVSIAPDGSFVVVWRDDGTRSCNFGNIIARRYGRDGKPLAGAFRVNPDLRFTHLAPAIGHDAEGNFVVVWQRSALVGTIDEVSTLHGQRYDAEGRSVGEVVTIRGGRGSATAPALAVAADGSFVVAWLDHRRDASDRALCVRQFDSKYRRLPVLEIASERITTQSRPAIAATADGAFAVTWSARDDDPWTGSTTWLQRFGGPAGSEPLRIGPATCSSWTLAKIAALPRNGLALVWFAGYGSEIEGVRIDADNSELATPGFAPAVAERVLSLQLQLDDGDERVRQSAAERIGCYRFHAADAVSRLREMAATDISPEVRSLATVSLALVSENPRFELKTVIMAAKDPDPEIRAAAARGLGILGLTDGAKPLYGLQSKRSEKSPMVRALALSALVDIGGEENLETLLRESLKDPDRLVRTAAAGGLVRLPNPGPDTADLILDAWEGDDDIVYPLSLVAHLGTAAVDALPKVQKYLESDQPYQRRAAIRCLTAMQQPIFTPLLLDPSPMVRNEAARGLRELGVTALAPAEATLAKAGERETDARVKGALDAAWHAWTEAQCLNIAETTR